MNGSKSRAADNQFLLLSFGLSFTTYKYWYMKPSYSHHLHLHNGHHLHQGVQGGEHQHVGGQYLWWEQFYLIYLFLWLCSCRLLAFKLTNLDFFPPPILIYHKPNIFSRRILFCRFQIYWLDWKVHLRVVVNDSLDVSFTWNSWCGDSLSSKF